MEYRKLQVKGLIILLTSTRSDAISVTAPQAVLTGIAPDGGLYMPRRIPSIYSQIAGERDFRTIARAVLTRMLEEFPEEDIAACVREAYDEKFDCDDVTPTAFAGDTPVLELFHGPTSAFKDVALSILPRLITRAKRIGGVDEETLILTATSGDTGSAALYGFTDVPGTRILVFYPAGGVSRIQRAQMVTAPGCNTCACGIEGNFDDAQRAVKEIFTGVDLAKEVPGRKVRFSSANSINIGRLAPQMAYYFKCYADLCARGVIRPGEELNFSVPTGNFGNILAGYLSKLGGLPVGRLICASNANNVLTDFIETGVYDRARRFEKTISPSMDILVSSNLERMLYLVSGQDCAQVAGYMKQLAEEGRYEVSPRVKDVLPQELFAAYATDGETKEVIARVFRERGYLMDPHTAVAYKAMEDFTRANPGAGKTVVLSTASPCKFPESVLCALGIPATGDSFEQLDVLTRETGVRVPPRLDALRDAPERHTQVIDRQAMRAYVIGRAAMEAWS